MRRFEQGLAELEGTEDCVAFASGMAALTACLLAACSERRHVVALRPLYGGTDHLLACGLLGIDVTWAEADGIAAAIRPETGLVLLETPQNPTLGQVDIAAVVAAAGGVPVLVDNTFATPILQNPARHGAALTLHSATKFLGGHGDVVAGAVACDADWAGAAAPGAGSSRARCSTRWPPTCSTAACRRCPFRVREAQERARALAGLLAGHPAVERVLYPEADGVQLRGPGAVLAFEVVGRPRGGRDRDGVRAARHAGGQPRVDGLADPAPGGLTHRLVDPAAREAAGVTDGLLRLSVGLEDVHDLWLDLSGALDRVPLPALAAVR